MNWLTLALKYLPTIIQIVVAVQGALKGEPTSVRKDVAMTLLDAAHAETPIPTADRSNIQKMVDMTVDAMKSNSVTGFTKSCTDPK